MLFLPHVFLQVGIKQVIQCAMHTPVSITGIKHETHISIYHYRQIPNRSLLPTERLTILRAATHETELGDHDFCLSRSHYYDYTDTDPTSRERAATAGIEPETSSPGVARSTD